MKSNVNVHRSDCEVYIASPVEFDECVALVEHPSGTLFVLMDEARNGNCVVQWRSMEGEGPPVAMLLTELRDLLATAEKRLTGTGETPADGGSNVR